MGTGEANPAHGFFIVFFSKDFNCRFADEWRMYVVLRYVPGNVMVEVWKLSLSGWTDLACSKVRCQGRRVDLDLRMF
ncbi:hypothetical protein KDH_37690 [Dictyobacter sp. S3.2.2.5]|uniref:Uncharacterized protein n=1 Tax=Dictyobacter halimunensis TaxID=3026934 RepID=A0ABQ6FTE4_9CHLR|nr:hypothetical protein KDH_37690 [Dictyobacter sp. S3.2.2.5]